MGANTPSSTPDVKLYHYPQSDMDNNQNNLTQY